MLRVIGLIENPFPIVSASPTTVNDVLNIIFTIIGGVSLLFVVIGGFRYVISRGEPDATARAKNTIIYALVGLAITLSATIMVNFVVGKL